jgi:hypothetical protein
VLPALAPRPVLAYQPQGDRLCNASQVEGACARLKVGGYGGLNCTIAPGVNALGADARSAVLAWLQAQQQQ